MKKLLVTLAAAALVAIPLAVQAQDHDGYQGARQDGYARSAGAHGYDADARAGRGYVRREGAARYGDVGRDRSFRGGFYGRNLGGDRGFYRRGDDGRSRGGVVLGFGYGGYPYGYGGYDGGYYGGGYDGGYYGGDDYDAAPYDGYGADDAYSYPDENGTYQPFDYSYSAGDDAYYAQGAPYAADEPYAQGAPYDAEPAYGGYDAPRDAGWSEGGPPADCGRWAWQGDRGAYEWIPAACERAPYGR